jgi:hypothetical protein
VPLPSGSSWLKAFTSVMRSFLRSFLYWDTTAQDWRTLPRDSDGEIAGSVCVCVIVCVFMCV